MGKLFNLSENDLAFARKNYIFGVIIYDIISNKRRLKLSHLLEGYGARVQRSCFEVILDQEVFSRLMADLWSFYDENEGDNLIVYKGKASDVVKFNDYLGAEKGESIIFL